MLITLILISIQLLICCLQFFLWKQRTTNDGYTTTRLELGLQPNSFQGSTYRLAIKSCKPHPSQREEGSSHVATIELSPWQKLDVTCALSRLHPLSWSKITSQRVYRMSAAELLPNHYVRLLCPSATTW